VLEYLNGHGEDADNYLDALYKINRDYIIVMINDSFTSVCYIGVWASYSCNLDIIEYMIDNVVNIDIVNDRWFRYANEKMSSSWKEDRDVSENPHIIKTLKYLYEKTNVSRKDLVRAMQRACSNGHLDIYTSLLELVPDKERAKLAYNSTNGVGGWCGIICKYAQDKYGDEWIDNKWYMNDEEYKKLLVECSKWKRMT
ncbi:hypothetical protein JKY79_01725, partial [Candidatus Babeliales bacterium]|nr:hypothetical protein [Candidatus Babeliales bacterium]